MSVNNINSQREVGFLSQRRDFTKSDDYRLGRVVTALNHQIMLQQETERPNLSPIKDLVETVIKAEQVANKNWENLSQETQELLKPMFERAHAIVDSGFHQSYNSKKDEARLARLPSQGDLTTEDKTDLVKLVADLNKQIQHEQKLGNSDLSPLLVVLEEAKEIIQEHRGQFSEAEKEAFEPLFAQTDVIVNEEHWDVDSYTWANSLKGLSPLFIGDLAQGNVLKDVNIPSFNEHFNNFKDYIEQKILPQDTKQLFKLFKAADEADFEELQDVCATKILSGDNRLLKGKLFKYALHSNQYKLVLKCWPHVIQKQTTEQVLEIANKLDKGLPKNWVFNTFFSVRRKVLQVQYEKGLLTIARLNTAYKKAHFLPEKMGQLVTVLQEAGKAGFKKLQNACIEKILSERDEAAKNQVFQYALEHKQYELILKCWPDVIEGQTSARIVEIANILKESLGSKWMSDDIPYFVKDKIEKAQHATILLSLKQPSEIALFETYKRGAKTLPENMKELFTLFKSANQVGLEELKNACLEKLLSGKDTSIQKQLFEYAKNSNQHELMLKCWPGIIEEQTTEQVIEIANKLDQHLPSEWVFHAASTVQGRILQAQYEKGLLTLHQLHEILTDLIPQNRGIALSVKNGTLKLQLAQRYSSAPAFFELISHIKSIKQVQFSYKSLGSRISHLSPTSFPHIEKVKLDRFKGKIPLTVRSFSEIFPHAKQYTLNCQTDRSTLKMLDRIPTNITRLKVKEYASSTVTNTVPKNIMKNFKQLEDVKWKSEYRQRINPHSLRLTFNMFRRKVSRFLHRN